MSITGDMIIDYEMATPDEFIDYYQTQREMQHYSDLEEIAEKQRGEEC